MLTFLAGRDIEKYTTFGSHFLEGSIIYDLRFDTFTLMFSFRSKAFDQELYKVCGRKEISVSMSIAAK